MMMKQSGLGRGLGALIPPQRPMGQSSPAPQYQQEPLVPPVQEAAQPAPRHTNVQVLNVPIHLIERNPQQPRLQFDHKELEELIASIKEHGILQPLVVTAAPNGRYQLIAGERRLRASTMAGLETVPAIIRDATNEQNKLELAIIENIVRQDLNAIEEAKAYLRLMDEFGMTQDDVSKKMGKSRPHVANIVRLLQLPEEIQRALMERLISTSHARTLLSLPSEAERMEMFYKMRDGNFTVRKAEEQVSTKIQRRVNIKDPNVLAAEDRLREHLESPILVKRNVAGEGEVRIKFFSDEEFNALMKRIIGEEE